MEIHPRQKMNIREIQAGDWAAFKAIRLKALQDSPHAFGGTHAEESQLSDEQWQQRARFYQEDEHTCFVLGFASGSAVAMAGAYRDKAKANVAHIYSVWTDPVWRGKGESQKLIDALADWALRSGLPVMEGYVTSSNARALGFYRQVGFELTDESIPLRWDASVKQILIRRKLAAKANPAQRP